MQSGALRIWDPDGTGAVPRGRVLYMTPEVFESVLQRPWPGIAPGEMPRVTKDRRTAMKAVLRRFVIGGRVNLEIDMAELGSKLPRPEHRGVWEFRSGMPATQTRIFGFFARPGAFVALDLKARDEIDFRQQCREAYSAWATLTGGAAYLNAPYPVKTAVEFAVYLDREDDV